MPQKRFGTAKSVEVNMAPRIRKEVMSGPHCDKWKTAMDEEIESLYKNNTWELTIFPKNKKSSELNGYINGK